MRNTYLLLVLALTGLLLTLAARAMGDSQPGAPPPGTQAKGDDSASQSAPDAQAGKDVTPGSQMEDVLPQTDVIRSLNTDADGNLIIKELRSGNPNRNEIALTFDDGPHPEYTSKLLAILTHYHVRATFFMVGTQAQRYPEWVRMVNQVGCEIGNHTYDHFRLAILPDDEVDYQVMEFQKLIERLVGKKPVFIRPPGGQVNARALKLISDNHLVLGWWTHNSKDVESGDGNSIYEGIVKDIKPGSIILMHDGSDGTVEMLPKLIETLQRRGFRFVTMSEMLLGLEMSPDAPRMTPQDHAAELIDSKGTEKPKSHGSDWKIKTY